MGLKVEDHLRGVQPAREDGADGGDEAAEGRDDALLGHAAERHAFHVRLRAVEGGAPPLGRNLRVRAVPVSHRLHLRRVW